MDRKAEIERKKAKLAAIKEERKRKEDEKKKREQSDGSSTAAPGNASQGDLREDANALLRELGIADSASAQAPAASQPQAKAAQPVQPQTVSQPQVLSRKTVVNLSASKVSQLSIPPKENVSYSKETQTVAEQYDKDDFPGGRPIGQADEDTDSMEAGMDTPPPTKLPGHKMPHVELAKPVETPEDVVPKEEEKPVVKELSEDEKTRILASDDFMKAFGNMSRVIERALYETDDLDITQDYTGGGDGEKEGLLAEGERIKLNRQFFDERWSKHRVVTSMDWSTTYPELLVASYNNNDESPHDPDGVALIWNIKFKKPSPEYIFHCQSAVMSTCFAKFHPNLIVGGTYSGQIVLWDNRTYKRTPVQRTPLSAAAHTHPVYCVQVVGTQNAHNLISISTDGKICSWSLDMLSSPQDSMELQHKQTKSVAVTSMAFFSNDVNNYVVGSEEGVVYTSCRHGSKAGIVDSFEGHLGPVTGIHTNNVPGQIDFSPYFLSSSFDWTVKLWNSKDARPLHSFEDNSEYVFDARWSPIHPALFATVDGMGRLDIWNCNNDVEVPTATTYVDNAALNKCLWHQTGHHIAVGDDLGKVHIYDIGESLANPKTDEWTKFLQTLTEMKQNQEERDEDRHVSFMKTPLR